MSKNFLSSLAVIFLIASCSDSSEITSSSSSSADSEMQTSFMKHVGMDGDRVLFGFDKSAVTPAEAAKLDKQVEWINQNDCSNVRIVIEGHCDIRGTSEYNLGLGKRRAEAVKNYMVSKGISPNRIDTVSYGKERPDAIGNDESSHSKNRRGVAVIVE